jgi:hypothetical protein
LLKAKFARDFTRGGTGKIESKISQVGKKPPCQGCRSGRVAITKNTDLLGRDHVANGNEAPAKSIVSKVTNESRENEFFV